MRVVAVDPRPERVWGPTFSCWVDELPEWVPEGVIAQRIEAPTVWTKSAHRIDRPYCVLSKPGLREALALDDATVVAGRATSVGAHSVELQDGTIITAAAVFDTRGLPSPGSRRTASAHGIFVDAERAAPMIADGEGLLLDWRDENGAGPDEPSSFLYSVPLGDGTVIFEETSLGLRGGMPQRELRRRTLNRLAAHGIRLRGDEPAEAAHYPLDQPPPPLWGRAHAHDTAAPNSPRTVPPGAGETALSGPDETPVPDSGEAVPFGSRGGMMHPCTGYSVADSLTLVDTAIDALRAGRDPVRALWPWQARLVYWMRMRGLYGLGRLTTAQSISMFEAFFTATPRQQRALLSAHDDFAPLAAVLFMTVARTWPFHWRYDLVGWTHRNRWVDYEYAPSQTNSPNAQAVTAEHPGRDV
jgi:lycopene beta-cyclase